MNDFISVTDYAEMHSLSTSRIRLLIRQGRIPAVKIGKTWVIPADTPKPEDKRVKSGKYKDWRKPKEKEAE